MYRRVHRARIMLFMLAPTASSRALSDIMSAINNLLISVYEPENKREDSDRGTKIMRWSLGLRFNFPHFAVKDSLISFLLSEFGDLLLAICLAIAFIFIAYNEIELSWFLIGFCNVESVKRECEGCWQWRLKRNLSSQSICVCFYGCGWTKLETLIGS